MQVWDWSWLDRRERKKSEKNQDEEGREEWNRLIDTGEIDDDSKVAEVREKEMERDGVAAVVDMEEVILDEAEVKRKRLDRLEGRNVRRRVEEEEGGDGDGWKFEPDLVTEDEDEIKECLAAAGMAGDDADALASEITKSGFPNWIALSTSTQWDADPKLSPAVAYAREKTVDEIGEEVLGQYGATTSEASSMGGCVFDVRNRCCVVVVVALVLPTSEASRMEGCAHGRLCFRVRNRGLRSVLLLATSHLPASTYNTTRRSARHRGRAGELRQARQGQQLRGPRLEELGGERRYAG